MRTVHTPPDRQRGISLLESLIAVLIFSIGILAIVSLQATSIKASTDAKLRADASFYASQIVAMMWVDSANIDAYALNAGGGACGPGGNASGNANVSNWITRLTDVTPITGNPNALPGAVGLMQQINVVATADPLVKDVAVTVCWAAGTETRRFTLNSTVGRDREI